MVQRYRLSVRRACALSQFSRAAWYRSSQAKDQSALRKRIREIAAARPRFGFQRIHVMLRREGWMVNRKRVHRLYRLEGLQPRRRVRRREHQCLHRGPVPTAQRRTERWSMDFVHDQLANGRAFRILTVLDQWSCEALIVEPRFSYSGAVVAELLETHIANQGDPVSITVDHGTEFTSRALEDWAWMRGIKLDFTNPGKPTENGHIESFNGRLRDECLNVNQFHSLADAKEKLEALREDYNHHRPHSSLGNLTPIEFVARSEEATASDVMRFQL